MAFRGRGRGRGGRGRGGRGDPFSHRLPKCKSWDDFPENVVLPSLPNIDSMPNEIKVFLTSKVKLENFWRNSCYRLEEAAAKSKIKDSEIERFSDRLKPKTQARREALASYLKLTPSNFPPELIQGSKRVQHDNKRLRWDHESGDKLFDLFEKLEEKYKDQDGKVWKDKNAESEDEGNVEEEAVEESSDDGDYNQNVDFDDDEDDLNMEQEEHEDVYD